MAKVNNLSLSATTWSHRIDCGLLLAVGFLRLNLASIRLRLRPIRKIIDATKLPFADLPVSYDQLWTAKEIANRLEYSGSRFSKLCLPQAIALRTTLFNQGIPSQLHFGFLPKSKRATLDDAGMPADIMQNARAMRFLKMIENRSAHVWVSVSTANGDQIIMGGTGSADYVPIASFD